MQGILFLVLALWLVRVAPRRHASVWAVVAIAAVWAVVILHFSDLPGLLGIPTLWVMMMLAVMMGVWHATLLAVVITFPLAELKGWRRAVVVSLLGLPAAYLIGVITFADLLISANGNLTELGVRWVYGVHVVPLAAPMFAFGWRWIKSQPGPLRSQMGYATAGFMLTNLNDALVHFVGTSFAVAEGGFLVTTAELDLLILNGVVAAGVLALAAVASFRILGKKDRTPGTFFVLGVFAIAILLTPLQFVAENSAGVHGLVDGLAFLIAFYGMARFLVPNFDIGWSLPGGRTVAFTGSLVLLFIVQQTLEQYIGSTFGIIAGGTVAGFIMAALVPLERVISRIGSGQSKLEQEPPKDLESYWTYRRFQIYRTALEGQLQEGNDPWLSRTLKNLRDDLSISNPDHERLLQDLVAARATGKPERSN